MVGVGDSKASVEETMSAGVSVGARDDVGVGVAVRLGVGVAVADAVAVLVAVLVREGVAGSVVGSAVHVGVMLEVWLGTGMWTVDEASETAVGADPALHPARRFTTTSKQPTAHNQRTRADLVPNRAGSRRLAALAILQRSVFIFPHRSCQK
jgi:hypothetical protein